MTEKKKMGRPPSAPPLEESSAYVQAKVERRMRDYNIDKKTALITTIREMTEMLNEVEEYRRIAIWHARHEGGASVRELAKASHLGKATIDRIIAYASPTEKAVAKIAPEVVLNIGPTVSGKRRKKS